MLQIVIPMAGAGSRFALAGYADPKPLIPLFGVPMIKVVIDNLTPACAHKFIFICQASHVAAYGLEEKLRQWAPGCEIVEIDGLTEGAACTVYAARHVIDASQPVMIANSDQYVSIPIDCYLNAMRAPSNDGLIMTMQSCDPKWSYVGFDEDERLDRVVEKQVISDQATVGIYNFRSGGQLLAAIESMVARNLRVNNEFYVAPVYNEMIAQGACIAHCNIGPYGDSMHGLGTPEDLQVFLSLPISRLATSRAAR
ncbi:glycosyltransferase family 2 protein [Pseudomonas sp. 3A(2025)]